MSDQIIEAFLADLRNPAGNMPPVATMRAAVTHADALAPKVYERLAWFCRGVCLDAEDENLLFYGLYVLAAARHPELWPHLVTLARQPDEELAHLCHSRSDTSLAAWMLSVWNGDVDGLLRLIEHADMGILPKWALFDTLARLTFDGQIPRSVTEEFLARFERESLADDDSLVWWGWSQSIAYLGLVSLQSALTRAWQKPAFTETDANEKASALAQLQRAASAPTDPSAFDEEAIRPVEDLATDLAWVVEFREAAQEWINEHGSALPPLALSASADSDPAAELALTYNELDWLGRFLLSRQVPETAMSLVTLDGFLMASTIGPAPFELESVLTAIWGEDAEPPQWVEGQQDRFTGLVTRHIASIAAHRDAGDVQRPLISEFGDRETISEWAEGFVFAVDLQGDAWKPLFDDRRGGEEALAVVALCEGENELFGRPVTAEEHAGIAVRLPRLLQRISAFWRDPERIYPRHQPIRAAKVGRNDPCPCGSGKKYKKCCALTPPQP